MFQHTSGSKSDSSSVPYHTVGKLLEVFPPRRTLANNDSLVFPVFGAKHNMTEAASPVSILYGLLCNSTGRRVQKTGRWANLLSDMTIWSGRQNSKEEVAHCTPTDILPHPMHAH